MTDYRSILHTVAENPGSTADEIEAISEGEDAQMFLQEATSNDDVVCVNDRYWIVRKGEFGYHEYDHPES